MQIDQVEDGVFQSNCPDPAEAERAETIGYLAHQMQHAGPTQDNIAFRLDMALALLERHGLSKTAQRLDADEYRLLSQALTTASARAYACPPSGLNHQQVMCGLLLVSQILTFWSLPDEQRAGASMMAGHLRDLARVLRNFMHNANLLNRVQDDLAAGKDVRTAQSQSFPMDPTGTMKLFIQSMTARDYSDAA